MNQELERLERRLRAAIPPVPPTDIDAAWRRLTRSMGAPIPPRPHRWVLPLAGALATAVLALMLRGERLRPVDEVTRSGELRTIHLSDGTSVLLAPGSRLRHLRNLGARREVELAGEAWFDVATDSLRLFVLRTAAYEVRVLGTSFGVRALAGSDSVTVAVAAGRVAFARSDAPDEGALQLAAGQGARAVGLTTPAPLSPAELARASAWRRGELRFDAAPLQAVADELARRFGLSIRIDDSALGRRPVTGVVSLASPDLALESVALTLDLQVRRTARGVELVARRPR